MEFVWEKGRRRGCKGVDVGRVITVFVMILDHRYLRKLGFWCDVATFA